jgi:WD40 repeat protein
MSEQLAAEAPAGAAPYASVEELKAEHSTLLRRRRDGFHDDSSVFIDEVETFLHRGYATGVVLGDDAERYAAQSLLTYWSNVIYRAGREVREDSLALFDDSKAPELEGAECPYVDMDQIVEGRVVRSAGWHRLIDDCLKAIERDRFVGIVGANGSGRSTLIHGGVLLALRNGALAGSEGWRFLSPLALDDNPLSDLLRILRPEADAAWVEENIAALRAEPSRLPSLLETGLEQPTVLVVEHFGERYRQSDKSQFRAFADALLTLAQNPDGLYVVVVETRPVNLSLVADLGQFGKTFQRNQVLITFTNSELRLMVEGPAKQVGLRYDDGVVDRLLLDVQGDPAALSLLQFTLLQLWENRQGNRVTHEVYDRLGGGRLAVARRAEELYSHLERAQQAAAQSLLLRLVSPESGAGVVCRSLSREQLCAGEAPPNVVDAVLRRLLEAQIVVRTGGTQPGDGDRYSVVHEAVATSWPRFIEWLDEVRDRQRWHLRLRDAAEQWREHDRKPDALVRGGALEQVLRERANFGGAGAGLADLEEEFLRESQSAESKRVRLRRGLIATGVVGVLTVMLLICVVFYVSEKVAENGRQLLGIKTAHWSAAEAARLNESQGDSAGALLWLAEAWKHLEESKGALKAEESRRLVADYQLRFGIALRRIPRIPRLLFQEANGPGVTEGISGRRSSKAGAISANGRFAATVDYDGNVRQWNISESAGPDDWKLAGSPPPKVNGIFVSDDGTCIVACTEAANGKGLAIVRRADSRKVSSASLESRVTFVDFHSDSSRALLATVSQSLNEAEITIWNADAALTARANPLRLPGVVNHVLFSPDGNRLAIAGTVEREHARVGFCTEWNLAGPGEAQTIDYLSRAGGLPSRSANHIAYSADGRQLGVACGEEGEDRCQAFVFHVDEASSSANDRRPITLSHAGAVAFVEFSPDGRSVLTASHDGTAKVWSVPSARNGATADLIPRVFRHDGPVFAAAFSPDGQYVVTAARDRRARIWDAETGEPHTPFLYHGASVWGAKFTPDGRRVVTQSEDMFHVWNTSTAEAPPRLFGASSLVDQVDYDPKTLRVAAVGYDAMQNRGWARIWDGKTATRLGRELPHPKRVTSAVLSPNGSRFLATVGADNVLRLWDVASGRLTFQVESSATKQLARAAFSPDGRWLVTAAEDRSTRRGVATLWTVLDSGELKQVARELEHEAPITFATFSPKSNRLLTVANDLNKEWGEAKVWETATGACHAILTDRQLNLASKKIDKAHREGIISAAFSENGRLAATAGIDNIARVWDVDAKQDNLRAKLSGHTADVVSAAFSGSGQCIVTTSKDGDAIIWNASSLTSTEASSPHQLEVLSHHSPVNDAAFSPDSDYLATGCQDGMTRIWAVEGGRLIAAKRQAGPVQSLAYLGEKGAVLAVLTLKPPDATSYSGVLNFDASPTTHGSGYQIGLGIWDLVPDAKPSTAAAMGIGKVLAARVVKSQVNKEDRLEVLTIDELVAAGAAAADYESNLGRLETVDEWNEREAASCEARRRWRATVWHLDRLIAARPGRASAGLYVRRAQANWQLGRKDVAIEDLRKAKQSEPEPNAGRVHAEFAEFLVGIGHRADALAEYEKSVKIDPTNGVY